MTEVNDSRGLLIMALRDLFDGKTQMARRLPEMSSCASDVGLRRCIDVDAKRISARRNDLAMLITEMGVEPEGQKNIWIAGILDDAENDGETIGKGVLRDIALTGALRKAKQSGRVSYETADVLAQRRGAHVAAERLRAIRDEEGATDDSLAQILVGLSHHL